MRRQALRDWLTGQGERWIDDPSNADTRYTRVRIRQHLAALEAAGLDIPRLAQLNTPSVRIMAWRASPPA